MNEQMLSLDEAIKRYNYSRSGFFYQAEKGRLQFYKKLGDKKSYLKVCDLEKLFNFHPVEQ